MDRNTPEKSRFGIRILASVFAVLGCAAFGNFFLMLQDPKYAVPILMLGIFVYGATAFWVAYGLWRFESWGFRAYLSWASFVVGLLFIFQVEIGQLPWLKFSAFLVMVLALLWVLGRFIGKRLGYAL
jgi:hypothetical protein